MVEFYLEKGVHILSIYVRESGAQLDRIRLIPATAAFATLEAEKTAMRYGAFGLEEFGEERAGFHCVVELLSGASELGRCPPKPEPFSPVPCPAP